jgi:LCP family protein required for cell wall assembly
MNQNHGKRSVTSGWRFRAGNRQPQSLSYRLLFIAGCLMVVLTVLAGCNTDPTPAAVSTAPPAANSSAPSPSPTWTPLPSVPAAVSSLSVEAPAPATASPTVTPAPSQPATATSRATSSSTPAPGQPATATSTATSTSRPSPTATASLTVTPAPSATATWTATPGTPSPTITPTQTITPTLTPTLTPTPLFTPTPLPTAVFSSDVVNILLLGLDSTQNLNNENSDVIIVAAVNKATKQVSMLSIPRDLWVYIPTYGWSRINVAHKVGERSGYPGGGAGLLMDTLLMNFGIPIDHWVRVDFQGFARAVDELGGVDMTVACPVNLRYVRPNSDEQEEMILQPGVYHMDGATALRYVRTRRDGSDFDRARRQQQFLKAVWNQTKSSNLLQKVRGLWSALKGSYQTDMNLVDVLSLAPLALDLQPQRIHSRYITQNQTTDWTNADGWRVLLPDYDKIQQVVASLYTASSASEDQVASEEGRIRVLNGTYRPQLALIAADQLRWYGLTVDETGPAEKPDAKQTQIVVFNDKPKTLESLARLLNVKPANISQQPDPNQPVDIQVILGDDYDPCR